MRTRWYQRPDSNWPQRRRWVRPSAWVWVAVLVLVVLTYRWWLAALAQVLVVDQPPSEASAILVLGGGSHVRQDRAVALYQEGWAPLIISSGEKPTLPGIDRSYAELGADYMVERGVPREAILLMPNTTSTRDEAVESLALARAQGFSSLLVITDLYHGRRSSLAFRRAYRNSAIALTFLAARPEWYNADAWWTEERSLLAVIGEYEKLVFYLLKGYLI